MVSTERSGKQIDADILRCKADILRSCDTVPPNQPKPAQEPKSQKTGENTVPLPKTAQKPIEKEEAEAGQIKVPPPQNEIKQSPQKIITMPAQKEPRPAKDVSPISQEEKKKTPQDRTAITIDTINPSKPSPPASAVNRHRIEPLKMPQEQTEIPRFDLAEEIMAEQRKITAIKRKAPDKKIEYQIKARIQEQEVKTISYTTEQMVPSLPEQEKIIAEIVARDIQRLCRG